jgi:phosphate transport system substrate-binding protein
MDEENNVDTASEDKKKPEPKDDDKKSESKAEPKAEAKSEKKSAAASRTYKVSAGDTLYSIAKKNDVEVDKLRAMNGLKDNNVHPGQVLKVGAR